MPEEIARHKIHCNNNLQPNDIITDVIRFIIALTEIVLRVVALYRRQQSNRTFKIYIEFNMWRVYHDIKLHIT